METKVIWNDFHLDLKRFILSKVKDEQTADDLLQEVFIKVHTKIGQLTDKTKLKSWLFAISRNTVNDYFYRNQPNESLNENEILIKEEKTNGHSELDCLPSIINQLPNKYKRPLYLADIKGVKHIKIAKKLNLPLPTIKSQIQRARKLIIQGYIDCCDYLLNEKGKLVGECKEKEDCKHCH